MRCMIFGTWRIACAARARRSVSRRWPITRARIEKLTESGPAGGSPDAAALTQIGAGIDALGEELALSRRGYQAPAGNMTPQPAGLSTRRRRAPALRPRRTTACRPPERVRDPFDQRPVAFDERQRVAARGDELRLAQARACATDSRSSMAASPANTRSSAGVAARGFGAGPGEQHHGQQLRWTSRVRPRRAARSSAARRRVRRSSSGTAVT